MHESDRWRHRSWPARSLEAFVVSFPKAGRTWLRVLLAVVEAHLRGGQREEVILEWIADDAPTLNGRRVLFTHALSASPAEPDSAIRLFLHYKGAFAEANRRLLVRDPEDPESFKTRRGEVGAYCAYLSNEDVAYVDARIAELVPAALGYREEGVPPPSSPLALPAA